MYLSYSCITESVLKGHSVTAMILHISSVLFIPDKRYVISDKNFKLYGSMDNLLGTPSKKKQKLDLQLAGSSPNLTYTKISSRDAIRIL